MNQSAVEWLIGQLRGTDEKGDFIFNGVITSELIEQAKQMEKQQIIDAANQIEFEDEDGFGISENITKGEQYYNETYGIVNN